MGFMGFKLFYYSKYYYIIKRIYYIYTFVEYIIEHSPETIIKYRYIFILDSYYKNLHNL